jgi:hypothetical protein
MPPITSSTPAAPEEKKDAVSLPRDKHKEYRDRIVRTFVGCMMGMVAGIISFAAGSSLREDVFSTSVLGFLIMLASIVLQKHVFFLMRCSGDGLTKKDWFYQGFMTFAFWFITWTLLMTGKPA